MIDTETTGLDPGKARVLEFAAVRIAGGRLDTAGSLRRLIDPGEPIPAAATRVHGIDDAKVAGAPRFAAAWPEIADALGDAILIGHSVGFDLAVLARECARAGLAWTPPAALDTRLLGEIAEPNLADFSLENLAAWLGVEIADRHSALGDALAAARVFDALIPRLRGRNIRTLAEAIRACRALTKALDAQHRAGWSETPSPAQASPRRAHRQLSVPPPRRGSHDGGTIHQPRRIGRSGTRRNDRRTDFLAVRRRARARTPAGHRHHHRTRHPARHRA